MTRLSDRLRSAGDQLSGMTPSMLPGWAVTAGIGAWIFVGSAIAVAIVAWLFVESAGISIPLVLAVVIGMVAYPLCDLMVKRGIPKQAAAALVIAMLLAVVAFAMWVTFAGVVSQWGSIQARLTDGLSDLEPVLAPLGVGSATVDAGLRAPGGLIAGTTAGGETLTRVVASSLGGLVRGGLAGLVALVFRVFIGLMLLYYVLVDFPVMADWVSRHMGGLPPAVGEGIVDDAVGAMRAYFRVNTISGLVVASVVGTTMLVMGVPLAFSVALVTFLTIYIPFFGAIFSGVFAFIVTLSSQGFASAIVVLVVILVAQNVLQTIINNRLMGDSLNLHPLVVLVVTMLGGIFGGLLGAALGAPLAALGVSAGRRLSEAVSPSSETESA